MGHLYLELPSTPPEHSPAQSLRSGLFLRFPERLLPSRIAGSLGVPPWCLRWGGWGSPGPAPRRSRAGSKWGAELQAASWRAPEPGQCSQTPTCTSRYFPGPAHELAGMLGPGCPGMSCQEEAASGRVASGDGEGRGRAHPPPPVSPTPPKVRTPGWRPGPPSTHSVAWDKLQRFQGLECPFCTMERGAAELGGSSPGLPPR